MKSLLRNSRRPLAWRSAFLALSFIALVLPYKGQAQGPGTMLNDRFGVNLQLQGTEDAAAGRGANGGFPFDWASFVPTQNLDTIEWTESDWIGAWFDNFTETTIQHTTAPGSADQDWGPSGGEPYDVEAMYFDNDDTNYYFAMVTSVPHYTTDGMNEDVGVVDPRDTSFGAAVRSGDLVISFFDGTPRDERDTTEWHYNYGVDITQENRDSYTTFAGVAVPNMRSLALGTGLYETTADAGGVRVDGPDVSGDWYTSSAPPAAGAGFNATTESDWEHTNFDPAATAFTGTKLGDVTVNYYDVGLEENDYPTYVYEFTIPRSLFGNNDRTHGQQIGFRFNPGCRNDGNASGQGSVSLTAVVDDLEMGDLIFEDLDDDGVYEPGSGETGINGVTVELFESGTPSSGTPYATTTTATLNGNAGRYRFGGLPPGDYYIHIPSTEFQSGGDLEGMASSRTTETDPDDDENEDGSGGNGTGSGFSLVGGSGDENGIDEAAPASNGISTGVFTLSAGDEPTGEDSAGVQLTDVDANSNLSVDLGFFAPANISGTTFEDTDSDGDGDVALNVTTIRLFASDGTTAIDNPNIAGTQDYVITTTDGTYAFVNLIAGSYVVKQDQPAGYQTVNDLDSTTDTAGSPADPANSSGSDNQIPVHVGSGESDGGNDFIEEVIPVVIGNYVWFDTNNDGLQSGESGISGVTVRLLDAAGDPVTVPGTSSTVYADDISGYTLDGDPLSWGGGGSGGWPAAGPWVESQSGATTDGTSEGRVRIEEFSSDQMLTLRNSANVSRAIDLSGYASATLSMDYERYNNDWTATDAFIVEYSSNGGTDWTPLLTLAGSGQDGSVQSTGDLMLPVSADRIRVRTTADVGGKRVRLNNFVINAAPPVPLTATTDGSGLYTFGSGGELSGSTGYRVSIDTTQSALAGYDLSPTNAGGVTSNDPTGDDSDSDASASGDDAIIVLTSPASGSNLGYDFGFTCPPIALDTSDSNPLPNGTVGAAYSGTLTASGGTSPYSFALKSGSALPAGLTLNANGTITGTPTAPASSLNFTVVATDDINCTGEATFTISIDCNTLVITPTTLADGQVGVSYGPVNFSAGGATGGVTWTQTSGTLPNGMTFSGGTLSGTPTEGGSFSFAIGASDANACSGSANLTLDIPVASIAGTTFEDTDNDDDGDVPINVTTIRLFAANGSTPVDNPNLTGTQDYVITTTDGTYLFQNLVPGSYVVKQDQPSGYLTVTDLDSSADAGGSPADPSNSSGADNEIPVNVGDGETDGGNDFVEEQPGSIAGSIFHDVGGDGSPSGDSLLTESLTIQLWTDPNNDGDPSDGVKVGEEIVTDGTYSFTNLEPGDYVVLEIDPSGYGSTGDVDGVGNGYNTIDVELSSGESDTGNDFYDTADAQLASVSGSVYVDSVDDDAFTLSGGSTDTAVGGSMVTLYLDNGTVPGDFDAGDTLVATTWTASDGSYLFDELPADDYVLVQGDASNELDVDGVGNGYDNIAVTLSAGEHEVDRDYLLPTATSIGSLTGVVYDDDGSGAIESGLDTPIPGITINLYNDPNGDGDPSDGVLIGTAVTGLDGSYTFDNLTDGSYVTEEIDGSGATSVTDVDEPNPNNTVNQIGVSLTSGTPSISSADFLDTGTTLLGISGTVYADGGNGVFGGDDTALTNAIIALYTDPNGDGDPSDGTLLGSETTTASGTFDFPNLPTGDYVLVETNPSGYLSTTDIDSTNDDVIAVSLTTANVTGRDFLDEAIVPGSIGGQVRNDTDADGSLLDSDTGVAGVVIQLWPDDGNGNPDTSGGSPLASTATDANGDFLFSNVNPGDYVIVELDPSGSTSTNDINDAPLASAGIDNEIPVTLPNGSDVTGRDFLDTGALLNDIGGIVYNDTADDNTLNGTGEAPVTGVLISLYADLNGDDQLDGGDVLLDTGVTGSDGSYLFTDLPDGNYVVVETDPSTATSDTDADGTGSNDANTVAVVLSGSDDLDNHFLDDMATASIRGSSFEDTGADDTLDGSGETGIGGVLITLYTDPNGDGDPSDGVIVGSTATATDGSYSFTELAPGNYVVVETQPGGYANSDDDASGSGSDNQVAVSLDGSGTEVDNNDFLNDGGTIYTLNGTVYLDTGKDNTLNGSGEDPIGGVTINLYADTNGNGSVDVGEPALGTTATATDGTYEFTNLQPGNYVVVETDPSGATSDDDTQGTDTDNTIGSTITNANSIGNDFLDDAVVLASISGQVRDDDDGDGDPADSDEAVPGVTIELYTDPNADGDPSDGTLIGTTTTDANGDYTFNNLIDGNYVVVESDPAGATSTYDPDAPLTDNQIGVILSGTDSTDNDFLDEVPKPATFAEWQTRYQLGGANGPSENPDGDLYDNLMEYALCLHPDSGIPNHGGFCVEHTSGQFDAIFRRAAGGLSDLTYTIQGRSTLPVAGDTTWSTIATIPGQGAGSSGASITDLGDGSEEVSLPNLQSTSPLSATAGFVRLLVTKGPDTSVTLVQGWLETTHSADQCATHSIPFLKKETLSGSISSVVFNSLLIGESTNLGTVLDLANKTYYLEIIEGDHEGHRFDIIGAGSGALTLSSDGNLCAGPPYNTLASLPPTLTGDRFVVREHYTIDELFPPTAPFVSGSTASVADRLLFYSDKWDIYFLDSEADPEVWQLDGEPFGDYGGTLVPPSQGLFIHPRTSNVKLLTVGVVRENDFALPLNPDYTLIPSIYPVDQSPTDRLLLTDYGTYSIDGGFDPAKADQISTWDGDNDGAYVEGYSAYFHLQGAGASGFPDGWRDSSDAFLTPQTDTKLFKKNRSAFLLRRSEDCDATYVMPLPWTPAQ